MRVIDTKSKQFEKNFSRLISSKRSQSVSKVKLVNQIINNIKKKGDKALFVYSKKYDKVNINKKNIKISNSEVNKIIKNLNNDVKKAINVAYKRIYQFHKNQAMTGYVFKDKIGNQLSYKYRSLNSIGIYVPGGTASYPSTLLMNAIPAIVAGVKNIYAALPCPEGKINPGVLYAAKKCKINSLFRVGGAQAIAALAYGTESIPKVDKIVGPGNIFVATAKKEVFGSVGIDMVAGPSEITVVADQTCNPEWTAIDLLSQAEHDVLSQSILITKNKKFGDHVRQIINEYLKYLPRNKIASKSIKNYGAIIIAKNNKEIVRIVDRIAPEHLEIKVKNPETIEKKISNAGSIFLGKYSPEAIGDYIAGTNHVLPTSGSARFSSGLSVSDFYKKTSIIKCSKSGIEKIGQLAINLAEYEGLTAHALSIQKRLGD
ncbi:MAG: histidinol dehydrogenase [Candidatus Pelagibacter sp.]|nr:histidinol dehydrogenase [Candidatus Pelagibacter sp.]OUV97599.1 MAG: histidinol dehydrogenase [Candidatus Pelagibacter sp. TMED142]